MRRASRLAVMRSFVEADLAAVAVRLGLGVVCPRTRLWLWVFVVLGVCFWVS